NCCASTRKIGSRSWKIRNSFSASSASACRQKFAKNMKSWRGGFSACSRPEKSQQASVLAAGSARRRVDGRHILGIKGCGFALEMKIGPTFQQSDATIPPENAVLVAGRPNLFRL